MAEKEEFKLGPVVLRASPKVFFASLVAYFWGRNALESAALGREFLWAAVGIGLVALFLIHYEITHPSG